MLYICEYDGCCDGHGGGKTAVWRPIFLRLPNNERLYVCLWIRYSYDECVLIPTSVITALSTALVAILNLCHFVGDKLTVSRGQRER